MIVWMTVGGTVAVFWIVVAVVVAMIFGRMIDLAEARRDRPELESPSRRSASQTPSARHYSLQESIQ